MHIVLDNNLRIELPVLRIGETLELSIKKELSGMEINCKPDKKPEPRTGKPFWLEEQEEALKIDFAELNRMESYAFSDWLKSKRESIKPKYEPHIERMIQEEKELEERTQKLGAFLATGNTKTLDMTQYELMHSQLFHMKKYLKYLQERLKLLVPERDRK